MFVSPSASDNTSSLFVFVLYGLTLQWTARTLFGSCERNFADFQPALATHATATRKSQSCAKNVAEEVNKDGFTQTGVLTEKYDGREGTWTLPFEAA